MQYQKSPSMVIHKTFSDFVLFLYVYIAFADGSLHPLERETILEKMKKLFPNSDDFEEKLNKEIHLYDDFDKNQLKTLFRDTFKQFSKVTFTQKYKIYTDMYEIVQADGKVHESETVALDALKEIIDLSH
jgi:uncharacterized tellurite resistance protein B-like protein